MEEILASIRRIISDDQADRSKAAAPDSQPATTAWAEDENRADELDLHDLPAELPSALPLDHAPARQAESGPIAEAPETVRREVACVPAAGPNAAHAVGHEPSIPLTSPETDASVSSAFDALASAMLTSNARTLEDVVREMLRPMLKVWLDDNLPALVERLVRAEIERVARGRS
jgi:cell pole-organizing protein PopZ